MQSFPLGVRVFLLFGKCICIFVAHHNKYRYGYYSKQRTNQVHFAKFERRESSDRHSGFTKKVRHLVPGCNDLIDSTSVFVRYKTQPSTKRIIEQ